MLLCRQSESGQSYVHSTMEHYHDMSEAPDHINDKIIRFAKRLMQILCEVYGCERVYLCTMCDGPNNHYHIITSSLSPATRTRSGAAKTL